MIRTIIAVEHDGLEERMIALGFQVPSTAFDLHAAIKAAIRDYFLTEEGKRTLEYTCGCFNWADFHMYISDELCVKHGFKRLNTEVFSDEIVNWDEDLTDGFSLEEDELE